jgi:hypothetical protein
LMRRTRSKGTTDEENGHASAWPPAAEDGGGSPVAAPSSNVVFEFEDVFMFGDMDDFESYYASLVQGLLVEPPDTAASWDDGESGGAEMLLWSYS